MKLPILEDFYYKVVLISICLRLNNFQSLIFLPDKSIGVVGL